MIHVLLFPSLTTSHSIISSVLHNSILFHPGHPRQPTLPLIRVRVIYHEENQVFNACRFGFKFEGLVANTEDLVIFNREKTEKQHGGERSSSPGVRDNSISVDDVSVIL